MRWVVRRVVSSIISMVLLRCFFLYTLWLGVVSFLLDDVLLLGKRPWIVV